MLVAEDNRTNQKVIGKMLEHAGHRVTIVATGQEAVEALEEPGFDLVLMDLNMPELGGIEAVKLLRFTHDVGRAAADRGAQRRRDARRRARHAAAVGFSAYLTKPVDTELLLRTLAELTGSRAGDHRTEPAARADPVSEPAPMTPMASSARRPCDPRAPRQPGRARPRRRLPRRR